MDPVWFALIIGGVILVARLAFRISAQSVQQTVDTLDENSNPLQGRPAPQSRIASPVWAGAILLFSFVLGAKLVPYVKSKFSGEPPPTVIDDANAKTTDEQAPSPGELEDALTKLETNTAASIHRAQLAEAKTVQKQFVAVADRALAVVGEWEGEMRRWDDDVRGLLTAPKGKYVAANQDLVRQYRAICSKARPDRLEAENTRRDIQSLSEPVRLALADNLNAYKPQEETLSRLNELLERASASRDEYRTARLQVETLVSTAQSRGVSSAESLQAAITAQVEQERSQANALLEQEAEKARAEAAATLAKAKADAIRLEAEGKASIDRAAADAKKLLDDQQAQRILDEAAAERRKQDAELKAALARKQHELLVQQFEREWPTMKTYLTPFVTPGFSQPTSADAWKRGSEKSPVSFGALKGAGVLEPGFASLSKLMYKTSANGWNDRPMGGFPQYRGGDPRKSQELLQQIQDFLNKYGDVMVEKELLLP